MEQLTFPFLFTIKRFVEPSQQATASIINSLYGKIRLPNASKILSPSSALDSKDLGALSSINR